MPSQGNKLTSLEWYNITHDNVVDVGQLLWTITDDFDDKFSSSHWDLASLLLVIPASNKDNDKNCDKDSNALNLIHWWNFCSTDHIEALEGANWKLLRAAIDNEA
jgi:hypothetical protein